MKKDFDPIESFADMRHEFGEHGGVNMSIETSTTYTVMSADTLPDIFQGRKGPGDDKGGCFLYGRHFNPTVYVLGRQLAALEGAEAGYCTASGMGAISSAVMQLCNHGDHIVSSDTVYGGTYALFKDFLPTKTGLEISFVDMTDLAQVEAALTPRTKVLYVESIANPTLRVADIPRLAELAHAKGAKLVVDNTFSPLMLSPIGLGADVVVHSLTKFINGASDYIAGAICGTADFVMDLMHLHLGSLMLLGPTMDPKAAFNISMRLPHLGLRMAEHSRRALAFAERLHEAGLPVTYPGLADHPDHGLFDRLRDPEFGYGGVLCLDLGDLRRANEFMEILQNKDRFGFMAVSLGYFETLMSCSSSTTSSELTETEQDQAGIQPGLVRMSIGYTGTLEQRWQQLKDALEILNLLPVRA
jgi:methionine-gamma-lyase